jgi:RimJ/RimL family protein N-acetyltransferase
MNTRIVPLAESHFEDLREVLDAVAREKRFLALTEAPPRDEAFAFYRNIVEHDHPHVVALLDEQVVGWCDILPSFGEARRHVGVLGIGLARRARHQGLGARLMQAAIGKAWQKGFTRIELTVRTDNHGARALYERLGFEHEGIKRKAFRVDGLYWDSHAMALLRDDAA